MTYIFNSYNKFIRKIHTINTDISTLSILYIHLYHIKVRYWNQYILFLTFYYFAPVCNVKYLHSPWGLPAAETGFMSYRNVCKQLAQHVYFSVQQLLRKQTSLFTNEISYMRVKVNSIIMKGYRYVICIYYEILRNCHVYKLC